MGNMVLDQDNPALCVSQRYNALYCTYGLKDKHYFHHFQILYNNSIFFVQNMEKGIATKNRGRPDKRVPPAVRWV